MSEEIVNHTGNPEVAAEEENVLKTKDELLAALQSDFATSVKKIYINSLGREYSFREITVQEQKSLTRMMSANENRKDIVYDAQCAIINKAALDHTFDIYKLSEFDRMKLLIALYQENMFQNEIKFTCPECGMQNKYKLDFSKTLHQLDEYVLEKKTFEYENQNFKYTFDLEYPSVKLVSKFYAGYCQKHGTNIPKKQVSANNTMTNLEYINLFITKVKILNKSNDKTRQITFANYKVSDIEDILQAFPQDVLYAQSGIMKYIVDQYIQPVNDSFQKHECFNCHTICENQGVTSAEGFL